MRKLWVLGLLLLLLGLILKTYTDQSALTQQRTAELHKELLILAEKNNQVRLEVEAKARARRAKIARLSRFCKNFPKSLCYKRPEMFVDIAEKVGLDFRIFALINIQEQGSGVTSRYNAYGFSYPPCGYRYCSLGDREYELTWIMKYVKKHPEIWGTGKHITCVWSPAGRNSFACRSWNLI